MERKAGSRRRRGVTQISEGWTNNAFLLKRKVPVREAEEAAPAKGRRQCGTPRNIAVRWDGAAPWSFPQKECH